MIIDTTLFNNEFDMLDIRLALTENWVDHWIICEGNRTLSGHLKPFYLRENINRYQQYQDRLTVISLDIPDHWTNWDIENGQRAALLQGYQHCSDEDIIMHSDLDEILNSDCIPLLLRHLDIHDRPVSCSLDFYLYRFDLKVDRKWKGNVISKKRHAQDPCTLYKGKNAGVGHAQKRKDRSHCISFDQQVGWHWGWIGNDQTILNKVSSCIETQNRDAEELLKNLRLGDTATAINHKCTTRLVVDLQYPPRVFDVIRCYPYWVQNVQATA